MSTALTTPKITARDRITFTLFLSIALNLVIILGITFDFEDILKNEDQLPALEVIIVDKTDDSQENEEAEDRLGRSEAQLGERSRRDPS